MQVLTDTYGRILTQHDPDGDVRTAVVWVPGDSRIDWDDASDQELVTLLSKYGYNDALTIENSNVTINTNGETEILTWDSVAMDFTADVDMFQNGAQNMFFRTVNDGSRDVTALCDADGKAIMAPTLGEYTSVLFSVANNGTEIDTITSGDSISTSAVIDACGGFVNVTALDAGKSVFLLVMGTHIQYCNADNTTTTPGVTEFPAMKKRLAAVDGKYYACSNDGKLMNIAVVGANIVLDCDANGQWNAPSGDFSAVANEFGGSIEVNASNISYEGFDVEYYEVTYKFIGSAHSLTPEPKLYV